MNEMMMLLSPWNVLDAAANVTHRIRHGRLADLRPVPTEVLDEGAGHPVRRYRPSGKVIPTGPPVLLVPPPGAPAAAFDLRRGCSLAEHLVATGRRVYLLDPERDGRGKAPADLETWVDEVLPRAVARVSEDVGGHPVQLVGWCLGGLLSLLAAAARPGLPIASVTAIAAPAEPGPALSGEPEPALLSVSRRIPPSLLRQGYRLAGIDRYLIRPLAVLAHLDDADFLAQLEAVDAFTEEMLDRPGAPVNSGNAIARAYEDFFRGNEPARGTVRVGERQVALADVRVPVLVIAGRDDGLAPWRAVHPLTRLLTGSPDVRFATAPGGHLGVLTGRAARTTTWARLDAWLDEGAVRHGLRAPRPQRERLLSRS